MEDRFDALEQAVRDEIEGVIAQHHRLEVLLDGIRSLRAEVLGEDDNPQQSPEPDLPEPEEVPEPDEEPDYEELRRLATHTALTMLRRGEKQGVIDALRSVGEARVTELRDEQLAPFLQLLERAGA